MIDARAIIDPSARLGDDVAIGPWTIVGPDVEIGEGCVIDAHVVLRGPTRLGARNRIFQFATIGEATPALAYGGEPTRLEIGDDNVFREGVTIHRGMVQDRGETRIGSNNLLMAYAHVGHDCVVGDHCVFANNASVSGHCRVGDWANLGGYAGVPQFRSIGAHAMVGGMSLVTKDVPACVTVSGNPAAAIGVNVEGLKRRGVPAEAIAVVRRAYRLVFRSGLRVAEALERVEALDAPESARALLASFVDSIREARHGVVRPRSGGAADREGGAADKEGGAVGKEGGAANKEGSAAADGGD